MPQDNIVLSRDEARRTAVRAAMLAGSRPKSILAVARHMGGLQMDPTSAVARSERLVLWSRLGPYDVRALERELWQRRTLFEYAAFIVPMDDFPIHRETMLRYPSGSNLRPKFIRNWLRENASFRRYVLERLRDDGPLRSRDLEDRAAVPWPAGGWNEGKNLSRMLEILWHQGRIATAGRVGGERVWDLAERWLPVDAPRPRSRDVTRAILERELRSRGIARRGGFGYAFDGRPPGWEEELRRLLDEGVVVRARVEGVSGTWFAHRDALGGRFSPRTTLLSPFDQLIWNRRRTEDLFEFHYRIEIYVPKAKRVHGYFVLPILHGDRLVGRLDPFFDRNARTLVLNAIYMEPGAGASIGPAVAETIEDFAGWLGAGSIALPRKLPAAWRAALRAIA